MMKKWLGLLFALCVLPFAGTMAAGKASGCGLGHVLWEGQSGLVPHIFAGTTNGTSGNQTFGITSGTSGCDSDSTVLREKEQEVFVAVNLDVLSLEMAQGNGEYLQALSSLMGCSAGVQGTFAGMTQRHYDGLFPSADTSTQELLSGLKREIKAHPVLAFACTRIS